MSDPHPSICHKYAPKPYRDSPEMHQHIVDPNATGTRAPICTNQHPAPSLLTFCDGFGILHQQIVDLPKTIGSSSQRLGAILFPTVAGFNMNV